MSANVYLRARTQPMTRALQGTAYASLGIQPPLANHECLLEARSHPHELKLPALTADIEPVRANEAYKM